MQQSATSGVCMLWGDSLLNLHMNIDVISAIAYLFNRKALEYHPFRGEDGLPEIEVRPHVPMK